MQFSMAFNQYEFNTKVDANETVDKSPAGLIKLLLTSEVFDVPITFFFPNTARAKNKDVEHLEPTDACD